MGSPFSRSRLSVTRLRFISIEGCGKVRGDFDFRARSMSVMGILGYLIVPKRLHGINQSGVASGDVAGEKRHGN